MPATPRSGDLRIEPAGDRELVMTRSFAAPKALVFEAWTRPELVRRWLLGPPGWTMPICEIDLRVGGAYRYVWRHEDGREMGMGGTYLEIARPDRLVCTERFDEAWYAGEAVSAIVLTEAAGRTTMVNTITYASRSARESVLASGMEKGVAASFDRLEEILAIPPG